MRKRLARAASPDGASVASDPVESVGTDSRIGVPSMAEHRVMRSSLPLALLATAGLAAAVWTGRAEVFLVDWTGTGGRRVALLPGLADGLASLVLAAAAVTAVWLAARFSRPTGTDRVRAALSPLLLFWWCAVPYAPILGDQFPLLLALSGGARWLIAALAVGGVAWALWGDSAAARWPAVDLRPAVLFVAAAAVYAGVGTYVNHAQGYGGDEPHYLVLTQSLWTDHDLRIENNHQRGDYREFFPGTLAPHFIRRGRDGVIYSIHAPGLPAVALPAYAIGGAAGVRLFIGVLAALAGVAIFKLCRALTGPGPALVAWLSVMGGAPLFFHGWLIFPETPAAALVAWAAWWMKAEMPRRSWAWVWRGGLLALFPWLHAKFAVLLACLGAGLAVRLAARRAWGALFWLALPVVVGLALWFYAFSAMYGVADPTIVYGGAGALTYELQWSNVPRGLLGFAFDQEYGLWLHAPVYLLIVPGLWWMLRDPRLRGLGVFTAIALGVFLVSTTRYYMWWGGSSVPGRFLVPIVPLCAMAVAVAVARASGARQRGVIALLVVATLGITVALTAEPGRYLMFSNRDGRGNLVEWLQGNFRLDPSLPTLLWVDWPAQLPAIATLAGGLLVAAIVLPVRRRREADRLMTPYWAGVRFLFAFALTVAAVSGLRASSTSLHEAIREGRVGWLDATGDARTAVDPTSFRRVRSEDGLPGAVTFLAPSEPTGEAFRAIGPMSLPPGRYRAAAWFLPGRAADGELRVAFEPGRAPVAVVPTRGLTPVIFTFDLPPEITPPPLWLGANALPLAQGLSRLDLTPLAIVERARRGEARAAGIDPVPGRAGAYLVYLDRGAFDEGGAFWTQGGREADLLLVPAGATRLRGWAGAGAAGGEASVTISGTRYQWTLAPGQRQAIDVALPPGTRTVPIHVAFSGGFRPADVDPSSQDRRLLGLRVELSVE